jgi:hypothetical protein
MRGRDKPGVGDTEMDISAAAWVEGWEKFLAGEREALVGRANGRLAYALRTTLPGESREELDRLIEEDRRLELLGVKLNRAGNTPDGPGSSERMPLGDLVEVSPGSLSRETAGD